MTIETFLNDNKDKIINDVIKLIDIPSIYDQDSAEADKPFGSNVSRCLNEVLDMAERMGFRCRNIDGYAGEITVGTGEFVIGILAHEDVVAEGDGWSVQPFDAMVRDERIYGRGASDDKGPIVSCLYVLKYLHDNELIPEDVCYRMIIGTNEEENWEGIEYYKKHTDKLPDYSIVPDGYFPLIFCEKGLVDFDINAEAAVDEKGDVKIIELSGGAGRNIVAGVAECKLECAEEIRNKVAAELNMMDNICAEVEDRLISVISNGKSTHAMSPEKGRNAINQLMAALGAINYTTSIDDIIGRFNDAIGLEYNGESLGCKLSDELSGMLTFNVGTIELRENKVLMQANLRFPASMNYDQIMELLLRGLEKAGFSYKEQAYLPPIYIDPESEYVELLLNSYRMVTSDMDSIPFSIGGATYARAIPNAVAFGPLFPYEEELAHGPDEYISIDSLMKMSMIYADALLNMAKLHRA